MSDTNAIKGTHVWLVLSRAASAVSAHADRHIESFGFCASDFGILECLLHKGAMPVNVIGRKILLTTGSITTAIDRLEKKGLVGRAADPEDRRTRIVDLTAEGRALIVKAFAEHEKVIEDAVGTLSSAEREMLVGLLRKLGLHAADMERGHLARNSRDASKRTR